MTTNKHLFQKRASIPVASSLGKDMQEFLEDGE